MNASPSASSTLSSKPNRDLFDQSALSDLAQRLVEAAKRAGADAADALAIAICHAHFAQSNRRIDELMIAGGKR